MLRWPRLSVGRKQALRFCGLLLLATTLWLGIGNAIVWGPLVRHWRVTPPPVSSEVILAHRRHPANPVLDSVADMSMTTDHPLRGDAAVAAARRLLHGELALPHLPPIAIDPGFARRDLSQGAPVQQLFMASLIVPDLLLRAYEHEPEPAYLAAAWRYARGFVEFESSVLLPRDFERNDHAIANRVSVLARLWRHLRQSPHYEAETGRLIHLHAARLGALLAKPSTFIAFSNHGVMQNIGLLQLAAAFPQLPQSLEWRRLAQRRLALQLPGWIGPDGAVLEHSAGYHFHGVVLSGYIVRLHDLLGDPVPPEWRAAYLRARDFMQMLQRPDRSLPPYGNTYAYAWRLPPALGIEDTAWERELRERASFSRIFPVSGHAIWWNARSAAGVPTHTHVPWGYFPGHGHRRAQELSLLVWAAETDWSTNTRYWPGDDVEGVRRTDGWLGGNGPHVEGEGSKNDRRSTLLARAASPELNFLDLERVAAEESGGTVRVRRQILQWRGSTWLVLDTYADSRDRPLRVLWTAAPETIQRDMGGLAFRFEREGSPVALSLVIEGSQHVVAESVRGRREPFAGWVAADRRAKAAPAVDATLASPRGWMLTTLRLGADDPSSMGSPQARPGPAATLASFGGPQRWTLRLQGGAGEGLLEVTRSDGALRIAPSAEATSGAPQPTYVRLESGETGERELAQIARARAELLRAHPRYRTREWERQRLSSLLLVGWGSTLAALIGYAAWSAAGRRRRQQFDGGPGGGKVARQ